jgi:formate hydrogenlyase transcriptional activator
MGANPELQLDPRHYESLLEIGNAITSHLDLNDLVTEISTNLRKVIPHDVALLTLRDSESGKLRLRSLESSVLGQAPFEEGVLISMLDTPEGHAITSGKPVIVGPTVNLEKFSSPWVRHAVERGVRSGCAVPLISRRGVLGALSVVSLSEGAFSDNDAKWLHRCGGHITIAVENALHYEQAKRERDRFEMMSKASRTVTSSRTFGELLRNTSAVLREYIDHDNAGMSLYDEASGNLRLLALENPPEFIEEGHVMPIEGTPAGLAFRTRQAVWRTHLDLDEFPSPMVRQFYETGIRSGCAVPLISGDRVIGVLGIACRRESSVNQASVDTLQLIANQIASTVESTLNAERARTAEREVRRKFERERLMLDVNNSIVSHLALPDLLKAIAVCLRSVIPDEFAGLVLYDSESERLLLHAIDTPNVAQRPPAGMPLPWESYPGLAFRSGKVVLRNRIDPAEFPEDPILQVRTRDGKRAESLCTLPLSAHGKKLGVLGLASTTADSFDDNDVQMLQGIAAQVAISVENTLAFAEIEKLKNRLTEEKLYLEDEIRSELHFEEIVGESAALKQILKQIERVAPTDSTILIRGETGTGKELIARAIHNLSSRQQRTLVKVNCAAIPMGLLESELFGHERGAFTGAISQRIGRFELAHKGTLFLDEVGDIPLELQPKLLRVLQEQQFERLGSTRTQQVDVRLVAATNADLEDLVAKKQYRSDLYYRLNVFPVTLPPLRERPEDIPLLVRFFAQRFARRMKKPIESIPAKTNALLARYHWPGNVRELENVVERAVILSHGPELEVPVGELKISPDRIQAPASSVAQAAAPVASSPPKAAGGSTLESVERDHILRVLEEAHWVIAGPSGAAERLGMKRTTLQARMRKLGIFKRT